MGEAEEESLKSSAGVIDFLKKKAKELAETGGGPALDWLAARLLEAVTGPQPPSDIEEIKRMLVQVIAYQKQILQQIAWLLTEVQFQHLITRSFEAVERILETHDRMQRLTRITDDRQRSAEAARLADDILNGNDGSMVGLRIIHDVLVGNDPMGRNESIIKLFADRWRPKYIERQLDTPISEYPKQLAAWLHNLTVIQYMGLAQVAAARFLKEEFQALKLEVDEIVKRLEVQQGLLSNQVPDWISNQHLLFEGGWYVLRRLDVDNGRVLNSQALYGSTKDRGGYILSEVCYFRDRNNHNTDEEWRFEPLTGEQESFILVLRSDRGGANYTALQAFRGRELLKMGYQQDHMRLGMARLTVPDDVPVKDAYKPVIVLTTIRGYLGQLRFLGTWSATSVSNVDEALRFEFEQA